MNSITVSPSTVTKPYARRVSMGQFAALVSSASAALAASSSTTPVSTAHFLAVLGRQSSRPIVRAALDVAA
jgi:hypothetical protein